jgi:hypothetical protein
VLGLGGFSRVQGSATALRGEAFGSWEKAEGPARRPPGAGLIGPAKRNEKKSDRMTRKRYHSNYELRLISHKPSMSLAPQHRAHYLDRYKMTNLTLFDGKPSCLVVSIIIDRG